MSPGDRVVVVTPLWPNLVEIPKIFSADVACVRCEFGADGWTLDLDRLLDALTPGTRALMVNSPNNPTGWTIDRAAQAAMLEHCDRLGIWIVADDVYERVYFAVTRVARRRFSTSPTATRASSARTASRRRG